MKEEVKNTEQLTGKENAVQVLKFVLFSISAGIIETISFTILSELFKLPYWPSYLVALILSVLWNFTLNREFTFKSANNVPKAMFKVACFYLVFTPATTILGDYLAEVGHGTHQRRLEQVRSALRYNGSQPDNGISL